MRIMVVRFFLCYFLIFTLFVFHIWYLWWTENKRNRMRLESVCIGYTVYQCSTKSRQRLNCRKGVPSYRGSRRVLCCQMSSSQYWSLVIQKFLIISSVATEISQSRLIVLLKFVVLSLSLKILFLWLFFVKIAMFKFF